jgi:hypothetical protein
MKSILRTAAFVLLPVPVLFGQTPPEQKCRPVNVATVLEPGENLYLPLKSYWRMPSFFHYTAQVEKQLASAQGLLGYRFSPARSQSDSGRYQHGRT